MYTPIFGNVQTDAQKSGNKQRVPFRYETQPPFAKATPITSP